MSHFYCVSVASLALATEWMNNMNEKYVILDWQVIPCGWGTCDVIVEVEERPLPPVQQPFKATINTTPVSVKDMLATCI